MLAALERTTVVRDVQDLDRDDCREKWRRFAVPGCLIWGED